MSSSGPSSSSSSSLDPSTLLPSSIRTCAAAIAASTALPGGGDKAAADWHFYSSFSGFRQVMSAERTQLVAMLKTLLEWNGLRWGGLDLEKASPEDLCELLTEINDEMLERAATATDEAAGIRYILFVEKNIYGNLQMHLYF